MQKRKDCHKQRCKNPELNVSKTNSTKYEKTQNQTKLAEDKIILILSKVGWGLENNLLKLKSNNELLKGMIFK